MLLKREYWWEIRVRVCRSKSTPRGVFGASCTCVCVGVCMGQHLVSKESNFTLAQNQPLSVSPLSLSKSLSLSIINGWAMMVQTLILFGCTNFE